MAGRPTLYTKELGDYICEKITIGISLATICQEESMPCPASIYSWLRIDKEFLENYEKAKENQADYFVEQTLTIPDTEEDVQRARLKVDVRKWAASKYKPKKYGDRSVMAVGGDPDGVPIQTEDRTTPEQMEALKQYILMKNGANPETV